MDNSFDYEKHERLRKKVANEADSVLWTFKACYKAADYYSKIQKVIDIAVFSFSAVISYGLVAKTIPSNFLVLLALASTIITGYKRAASPENRAEEFYRAANSYQRLFDEFMEYISLELADDSNELDELVSRYEALAARRRELNEDTPNMTSKWYNKLDESVYEEVSTSPKAEKKLTSQAQLEPPDPPHNIPDEEVSQNLAEDANLTREKKDK